MTGRLSLEEPRGDEPFLLLSADGEAVEARGTRRCVLGRMLSGIGLRGSDGIFAGWSWDGDTARVHNDRYGMCPLYYSVSPGRLGLSPSVTTLLSLGAPTDLD